MKNISIFWRKMLAVAISILLLSIGWLGATGLTLLVALIPLLWISAVAEDSRRGWWGVFGWSSLTFVGWNLATIWWIGYATPVGPFAATLASAGQSILVFMLFHTVSRKAPKALAYTLFVSLWIALEYNYTVSEFSWPWLLLGNGFSNDIWAVQWYEFTGIFGGSLWVLLSNLMIFEALRSGRGARRALLVAIVPLILSGAMFLLYDEGDGELVEVSVVQPNVDCYEKFSGRANAQERNLLELLSQVPQSTGLILMPETAIPRYYSEATISHDAIFTTLRDSLAIYAPDATLISGANTRVTYREGEQSRTARAIPRVGGYYDHFNSAVALNASGVSDLRHKARLVIGVENTPTWIFDLFKFFVIDLGGVVGQIGVGTSAEPFDIGGGSVGTAICYEGLYGDFYGGFVRGGADIMAIISNDGWWGDTPGYRHLYSISALRAIEHRRAIARSANTGVSGFITARGVSVESLGWEERGVLTHKIRANDRLTLYTRWGDYIARIAVFVAILSLLYYISYRARKRHHIV